MQNNKIFNAMKSAIEFCGQHPFATGLLAIFSIAGLILSVLGFQFDRQEAADTTDQISNLREDIVRDDTFNSISFALEAAQYEYRSTNNVSLCSPRDEAFASKANDFFKFLLDNQGETVFLNFSINLEECNIIEYENHNQSTSTENTIKAAHYIDFSSHVYEYKHIGLNNEYLEKAKNVYSPAFVLELDKVNNSTRRADTYVATFWPPLSELRSYRYNADEYGQNLISGLFKIFISSASGAYAIELLPVEAVDFDKYERTVELLR